MTSQGPDHVTDKRRTFDIFFGTGWTLDIRSLWCVPISRKHLSVFMGVLRKTREKKNDNKGMKLTYGSWRLDKAMNC